LDFDFLDRKGWAENKIAELCRNWSHCAIRKSLI